MTRTSSPTRLVALTTFAIVAFAANSVLCRWALGQRRIDAATFCSVRILSGAFTLVVLSSTSRRPWRHAGSWRAAGALTLYAVPFSFAYNSLSTGTGALILFGAVQATMLAAALRDGDRPRAVQWCGLGAAFAGLVWLLSPGIQAPPAAGAAAMALAGAAWGAYSLIGRGAKDALGETTGNFARAVPLVGLVSAVTASSAHATPTGLLLAVASGAVASGIGYAIWYAVLPSLRASRAATVQLLVPVVASVAGVLFLGETPSVRLAASTLLVVGGVGLFVRMADRTDLPLPAARTLK